MENTVLPTPLMGADSAVFVMWCHHQKSPERISNSCKLSMFKH